MVERLGPKDLNELRARRWRADDARRVLEAWRASGLSMRAFGAEHEINAERLAWWKARLREWSEDETPAKAQPVARLVPALVRSPGSGAQAVLRLPGGVAVEVIDVDAVSPEWLSAVVAELSRAG